MSIRFCVLGSGSGGNATVVCSPRGTVLLDAGLGPRTTATRLAATGSPCRVAVTDVAAICLTHLDRDHFNTSWLATIVKQSIRVYCHDEVIDHLLAIAAAAPNAKSTLEPFTKLVRPFATATPFEPVDGLAFHPVRLAHDEEGAHGFLLSCGPSRIGYATDLGHVPDALLELFRGVHVLALESNYDPDMERNSDRPWFLKQRVMGGSGHLSNDQAYAAVRAILDATERTHGPDRLPRHIVLLHRSRQCNCPNLLRRLFETDQRIRPVLTLADQHHRTPWLTCDSPRQLTLALP